MDLTKEKIMFQSRQIEIIRVIFSLAFNLNIDACLNAKVDYHTKTSISSKSMEYYEMILDFKAYYLSIDEKFNIAGGDGESTNDYPPRFAPVSNQLKIAFFLINNNLVSDIIKQTLDII